MIAEKDITALILCGGAATRMGGVDKPLQMTEKAGLVLPMLDHVIATLPANAPLLISANRSLDTYALRGSVITDGEQKGFGPLLGVLAGLRSAQTEWLLVCPGDMPYLEQGWHEAIRQFSEKGAEKSAEKSAEHTVSKSDSHTDDKAKEHVKKQGTERVKERSKDKHSEPDSVVVHDGTRLQPLLCLIRTSRADDLQAYLQSGEFSVHRWHASLRSITISYKDTGQFLNINTFAELQESRD
ncbi:molybdenum cofactor guanylyltransferase [Pseudomonadales bacterium]|nr:molybdenum cofactor guanylyltransferase [Pseudomonadales bacterium]